MKYIELNSQRSVFSHTKKICTPDLENSRSKNNTKYLERLKQQTITSTL